MQPSRHSPGQQAGARAQGMKGGRGAKGCPSKGPSEVGVEVGICGAQGGEGQGPGEGGEGGVPQRPLREVQVGVGAGW